MTRDALIVAFAKLRAADRDARADLLAATAGLPRRQCAALKREIEAVAALFTEIRPTQRLSDHAEPEPRKGRLTKRERAARRHYFAAYASRLSSHIRAS